MNDNLFVVASGNSQKTEFFSCCSWLLAGCAVSTTHFLLTNKVLFSCGRQITRGMREEATWSPFILFDG
jgi:hypothetical protein